MCFGVGVCVGVCVCVCVCVFVCVVLCGAVRCVQFCVAVRCGAVYVVLCGAVRCGAVRFVLCGCDRLGFLGMFSIRSLACEGFPRSRWLTLIVLGFWVCFVSLTDRSGRDPCGGSR